MFPEPANSAKFRSAKPSWRRTKDRGWTLFSLRRLSFVSNVSAMCQSLDVKRQYSTWEKLQRNFDNIKGHEWESKRSGLVSSVNNYFWENTWHTEPTCRQWRAICLLWAHTRPSASICMITVNVGDLEVGSGYGGLDNRTVRAYYLCICLPTLQLLEKRSRNI